jgi:hypothetical protein
MLCPGKKDYVNVTTDEGKVQKQKRLLLVNLNELYSAFKDSHDDKIGFSKFCELRPKWCVSVGPKGTHSVCVCQHHQNAKQLLAALPVKNVTYQEVLSKIVCDLQNRDCMLHACEQCPGKDALKEYLNNELDSHEYDLGDSVKYKQWMHTDRTTLFISLECTAGDFVDLVCDTFCNLAPYHFITKCQSVALNTKIGLIAIQQLCYLILLKTMDLLFRMLYKGITGIIPKQPSILL